MDVKLIKFSNGEEIITKVSDYSRPETLTVKDPLRIVLLPPQDRGQSAQMGFGPWVPYVKDREFRLNRNLILFIENPEADLVSNYHRSIANLYSSLVLPEVPNLVFKDEHGQNI